MVLKTKLLKTWWFEHKKTHETITFVYCITTIVSRMPWSIHTCCRDYAGFFAIIPQDPGTAFGILPGIFPENSLRIPEENFLRIPEEISFRHFSRDFSSNSTRDSTKWFLKGLFSWFLKNILHGFFMGFLPIFFFRDSSQFASRILQRFFRDPFWNASHISTRIPQVISLRNWLAGVSPGNHKGIPPGNTSGSSRDSFWNSCRDFSRLTAALLLVL